MSKRFKTREREKQQGQSELFFVSDSVHMPYMVIGKEKLRESNLGIFRHYWTSKVDACCFRFFSCKCWQNAVLLLYILTQVSAWGSLHIYKTFVSIWVLAGSYYSNSLARCSKGNCKSTWLCGCVRPLISDKLVWRHMRNL